LSARRSRRLHSCPSSLRLTSPLESVSNPQRSVPASGRCHARICSSPTSNPLLHSAPLSFRISEPFMLSKLAAQCESPPPEIASEFEPIPVTQLVAIGGEFQADSSFCYSQCFSPTSMHETLVPRLQLGECSSAPSNASARFHTTLFPIVENRRLSNVSVHKEEDHTKPIMLRKKKQRLAKMKDPLHNVDWLNVSPRVMQLVKNDLPKLFEHVRGTVSNAASIVLVSPRTPIGLSCMESWDSYIRMLEEYNRPHESVVYEKTATPMVASSTATASSPPQLRQSVPIPLRPVPQKNAAPHSSPVPTPDLLPPASSPPPLSQSPSFATPPPKDPAPPPHHSPPTVHRSPTRRLPTPVMPPVDTTPYTLPSTSCVSTPPREPSPPRVHLSLRPSTNEPPRFNTPVYMEVEKEVEVVPEKREHVLNYSELQETTSHMDTDSSSEDENAGRSDFDLGAFELVDSGITAETLLSKEEPVIFHKRQIVEIQDIPVHSVHHDTVQTETALANLMSAPSSMLTGAIPPTMVEDNYCFVVDGEQVRMGDILGDEQWWRHTSRPTKYFYSEDLRQFYRVNCIAVKGKVIAAKLAGNVQQAAALAASSSSASTPRSSVSGVSARLRDSTVPLTHVYKVIRFYSFWKTCTSFHRIVTMIDRVVGDPHPNPDFKKRLFVQYLWRNAKPIEKARVQKEFDPQRQRLLRYVTNPLTRKRF
uniref:SH3 domain-containing protein n=1 Tax=Angiostrongylus cantonensis TaxID=6313 RepID=A0A158PCQ2_ANGCA